MADLCGRLYAHDDKIISGRLVFAWNVNLLCRLGGHLRMNDLRDKIQQVLSEVAEQSGQPLVANFNEETSLLESGLDSLGFAIVVARLEIELGYDPFRQMTEAVYPRTFGEFISFYEKLRPQSQ